MNAYFTGIWEARYFWIHLALADLRSRWRRSFFGVLWSLIQPLGMTLLLALVFSRMFHSDITTYAPYILSGIILWEFMMANVTGGSLSFVQADAYIKQCRHPLAIYTLRTVLSSLIVLMMASIALFGWTLVVLPHNFGWCWLAALTAFPVVALIAWPMATLLAYIGVRFRDVPHAMGLVMQALWFVSPVYFQAKMFRSGGLSALVDYNPVYHVLQLVRAPLLHGTWPTLTNYLYSFATAAVFALLAWQVGRKAERKVIFYL
jgi:lipopolysaccharide transport system permease protein